MWQSRFRLISTDKRFIVETMENKEGENFLKAVRKNFSQFKGGRIKAIIQAEPDKVPLREIVDRNKEIENHGNN